MLKLFFHDNTPAAPGQNHGPDGPTHAGTARVDYPYQVEMLVQEIFGPAGRSDILFARSPELQRAWRRTGPSGFEEVPFDTVWPPSEATP
jgi:hypothetical protein